MVLAFGCDDASGPVCGMDALDAALRASRPGDTIALGACTFTGNVTVPDSRTLMGQEGTRFEGTGDVVTLESGASISEATISVQGGRALVLAAGPHALTTLRVHVDGGIGIRADEATGEWRDVIVEGALDPLRPDTIPPQASTDDGHYPIVILDSDVDLFDVGVLRGGPWGVIVQRSRLDWVGGEIREVVGTGLFSHDSTVQLRDLEVRDMLQGIQPHPAYGVIASDTQLEATAVHIADSDGLGVLMDGGESTLRELDVTNCSFGGLWLQRGAATVEQSMLDANGLAGMVARQASRFTVRGTTIQNTVNRLTLIGVGAIEAGDGIHLDQVEEIVLGDLTLRNNARISLLIETPGASLSAEGIRIEGGPLGALQQASGMLVRDGWDADITRTPELTTNDMAQLDALELVGALPSSAIPLAGL